MMINKDYKFVVNKDLGLILEVGVENYNNEKNNAYFQNLGFVRRPKKT